MPCLICWCGCFLYVRLVANSTAVVILRHMRGMGRDVRDLSAVVALFIVQLLALGLSLPATIEEAPTCKSLKDLRKLQIVHLSRSYEYLCWCVIRS
jgi:hypothetical protein